MRGKFSALMAMSVMAAMQDTSSELNPFRKPSRNTGRNNTFVPKIPPKPDGLKDWGAYGYWVVAASKKAASKKIMAAMQRDNTLGCITLKDILKDMKQKGKL